MQVLLVWYVFAGWSATEQCQFPRLPFHDPLHHVVQECSGELLLCSWHKYEQCTVTLCSISSTFCPSFCFCINWSQTGSLLPFVLRMPDCHLILGIKTDICNFCKMKLQMHRLNMYKMFIQSKFYEWHIVGARAKGRKNILTTFQETQKTVFHLYLVLHIKGFLYNTVHFNIVC